MNDASHGRHIEIVEVGLRDGLQIEPYVVPAARKIELLNQMIDSGLRRIEVTSFVSPRAVPQLADAAEVLAGANKRADTCLIALVPNVKGAERAAASAVDCGALLCSASETHNRKNLNRGLDETLAGFPAIVDCLRAAGKQVTGGMATAFGCPFEGDVDVGTLLRITEAQVALGIDHVTLGDTTGMATPANIRHAVRRLRREFPDTQFTLHLHNTRGIGLANVLVGIEEGIRCFDASSGGLGGCPFAAGATGNICTEDLLYLLHESGYQTGVDFDKAIQVALELEKTLGKPLPGQVMRAGGRLRLHDVCAVPTAAG